MRPRTAFVEIRHAVLTACLALIGPVASASEEGGAAGELPPFLQPNAYLAFWTLVVFLGLLFVLGKFAWKPLLDSLQAREKHIRDSIQEAERARDQAKALLAEHDKKLAEVQNEVRAILDEARRDGQHTQTEILKQAQAEAQAARDRAKREIEQARDVALKQLFDQAADLATEVAGRIVQRSLNPQDHRDLVQQALNELPSKN